MLFAGTAAWRVVALIVAAVAPWAAPVEVSESESAGVAIARLVAAAAAYALATWGVRRATPRYPGVAALSVVALLVAPVVSAYCSGPRGPLGRGMWVEAPFVWAALAAIAAGPVARGLASARARTGAGVAVVIVGVASLAAGRSRFLSRDALWRSALAADPGNESAALAVAANERASRRPAGALDVLLACSRARTESCPCAEGAATVAIDLGHYLDARRQLDASDSCARTPRRTALRAEALMGTDALDEGRSEAERAVERAPDDPHAVYARAWGTTLAGKPLDARADAERAVALGRGVPAELLLGLILYRAEDLAGADALFVRVLSEEPSNVQATYDHALVADRTHRYHDAREGYLHTLQLDPKSADARFNLVVLTQSHGATLEAQHHFEVFVASFPGDPRASALRQVIATEPPVKAMTP